MCELCVERKNLLEKSEKGVLLNEKKNKGTQYRFVREYEKTFKGSMAKTLAVTTKTVLKKLGEQMDIAKG